MTTPRVRNRITRIPLTCGRCGNHCPAEFRICDGCTDPEHARRRAAGVARRSPEERMDASALSPENQRIDAAFKEYEASVAKLCASYGRITKRLRDDAAGVIQLATKRPHATAIAGASTGTPGESR